jgi:DNA-binding MarR family transcriptional regulator
MVNTKINEKIMEVFFEISRSIREKMSFDCNAAQLTVLQLQTLILISKNKTLPMGDIANEFKISLPTATVLSDKLVKMKLVKRNKNVNDRRIVNVSLTEKGKALLKKAMKQRHVKINELLSYLPLKERQTLFKILNNLSSNLKKTYEK